MTTYDEPSIYNLLTVEEVKEKKPKKHTSKFRETVKEEYVAGRDTYKTMGPAKVPPPQPTEYLKKHEKEPQLPKKEEFHYACEDRKKPAVPKKDETPLMGLKTTKNFINTNAVENITSVPKVPVKKFVDTRHGDTHELIPSGFEPIFVHKKVTLPCAWESDEKDLEKSLYGNIQGVIDLKPTTNLCQMIEETDFGEVPTYLVKRKEEIKRAQEEYDQYIAENFKRGALRQLSEDERQAILDGLKANWEDIQDQYQSLSVVTDTYPKKQKKERLEAQMKQLERDIELFEKHKLIYIGN